VLVHPDRLAVLRAQLDADRKEYARRRAEYLADLAQWEVRVRRLEAEIEAEIATRLKLGQPNVTLRGMANSPLPRTHGAGRPSEKGPLQKVGNLYRWAVEHDVPYSTVKAWRTRGRSGRAIPLKWALVFRKEYGVPLEWWPNGHCAEGGQKRLHKKR
jgi:hypothetical protein